MKMDIKSPVITETTSADFSQRLKYWKRNRLNINEDMLLARIDNPLAVPLISDNPADDYFKLLKQLVALPYADELCVRSPDRWIKEYTRRITKNQLEYMAESSAKDQAKINYLEIKLQKPEIAEYLRGTTIIDRPVIEFVEYCSGNEKSIVGYRMLLPVEYKELFTIASSSPVDNFALIHGMWIP